MANYLDINKIWAGGTSVSIGFVCVICNGSETVQSYQTAPNPPICRKCLLDLKEVVLEKRRQRPLFSDEIKVKQEQIYKNDKLVSTDVEISGGGGGATGGKYTKYNFNLQDLENAFNAAREELQNPLKSNPYWVRKYKTFQDYVENKPTVLKNQTP